MSTPINLGNGCDVWNGVIVMSWTITAIMPTNCHQTHCGVWPHNVRIGVTFSKGFSSWRSRRCRCGSSIFTSVSRANIYNVFIFFFSFLLIYYKYTYTYLKYLNCQDINGTKPYIHMPFLRDIVNLRITMMV